MRKKTVRGWRVDDGYAPGWQNTGHFMAMYPTRPERRAFYKRRQLYYEHVREAKATRTCADLARYMNGQVKAEKEGMK